MKDKDIVRDRDMGDEDKLNLDDPLGIAREPVSPDSSIRASADPEEVRQRRRRVSSGLTERRTDGLGDLEGDPFGAKGIDMGSGGDGTDVKSND